MKTKNLFPEIIWGRKSSKMIRFYVYYKRNPLNYKVKYKLTRKKKSNESISGRIFKLEIHVFSSTSKLRKKKNQNSRRIRRNLLQRADVSKSFSFQNWIRYLILFESGKFFLVILQDTYKNPWTARMNEVSKTSTDFIRQQNDFSSHIM